MIYAATGHRPDKLGGYNTIIYTKLRRFAMCFLLKENPTKIISGMALGWDQAIAEAAIECKIPVIAALPFGTQESKWPDTSRDKYVEILSNCSEIKIVCEGDYSNWKYQERNQWMVNHCDILIALWNGSSGGTCNCIAYAEKKKTEIINLWDKWKKFK